MDTLCKPNFMFLGRTVYEKNVMITCKISKLFIRTIVQLWILQVIHSFREKCDDNLKLASHFSPILCDRGTWNFFYILTHMDTSCKPNFMFLGRTVYEKNVMITCKISKLFIRTIVQLWILQVIHSFREKCDDNLKLASHFSQILWDQGTWNFFCILTRMDTLCKPNFMFLGITVFEKNAMITWK